MMICAHCGQTLDGPALQAGFCPHCGVNIAPRSLLPPGAPADQLPAPTGPPTDNSWADWATGQPPPDVQPTGPTAPLPGGLPPNAALYEAPTSRGNEHFGNDLTEPGLASGAEHFDNDLTEPGFARPSPGAPPVPSPPQANPAPVVPLDPSARWPTPQAPPAAPPFAFAPPPGTSPPPGYASAPVGAPPRTPASRAPKKTLALAGVAGLLLLALIGGIVLATRSQRGPTASTGVPGSSPASTPTATSIPFLVYQDPNGLFSISYPYDWPPQPFTMPGATLGVRLSGVQFLRGLASFTIVSGDLPLLVPPDVAQVADGVLLQSMGARASGSPEAVTIGGQRWTQERGATTSDQITIASISLNNRLYSLWYRAPKADFATDDQAVFMPMLASFRFGG